MRPGALVVLVVVAAAVARADDATGAEADLARLVGEMEERESALRELLKQEKSITRALGELDESIARMDARAAQLDARATAAEQRVAGAELEAARLTSELERSEAALTRRLRGVMWLGPQADVQLMLGARSMRDLLWTRHVLRRMAVQDAALVKDVEGHREALLRERETLIALHGGLAEDRRGLETARRAAAQVRASRAAALADVGVQRGVAQRRLEELAASRRRLRELMDELPAGRDATGFAALKGHLGWPTDGTVEVGFGPGVDPRTGVESQHSGISLVAPLGQKVVALARGRVVHAGWLRGFGQLLIIDHGDGYHALMAHLSRMVVQAGDEVTEGDVVAFVGDSESLVGPRLYLELRARGRPVDPLRWLKR